MTNVRIADFKSRVREYFRRVRGGNKLMVLDRNTPIARVVPCEENGGLLKVRSLLPTTPRLQRIPFPPPLRLRKDIVELLLVERQGKR
jgi:antitoxin (DNA-binding transcriptional repressor) of toxin-antitoxin stability system